MGGGEGDRVYLVVAIQYGKVTYNTTKTLPTTLATLKDLTSIAISSISMIINGMIELCVSNYTVHSILHSVYNLQ